MLWKTAAFCGVEVLAFCVMSNHFHVLVRVVPVDGEKPLERTELLRRYRAFYGEVPGSPNFPSSEVLTAKFEEGGEEAEQWERRLRARMGDVSEFMKTLKQRFTIWFNKSHRRFGTLWSERFKSVLVEDSAFALKTVAAYIDLNPVRAGLVQDPADYRWCSYAEALAGKSSAREGICAVVDLGKNEAREALEAYRMVLFGKGGTARRDGQATISAERVSAVLTRGGRLEASELLRMNLRHMTEGAVLGSRQFVQRITLQKRASIGAPKEAKAGRKRVFAEIPLRLSSGGDSLVTFCKPRNHSWGEIEKASFVDLLVPASQGEHR
jgi:REP element-mobilizing transposase RayT